MKYMKSILSMMLVGVFMVMSLITASGLELGEVESGIYEIQNDVYHENPTGMSMSRTYLDPTMEAEVRSDKVIYTVKFSGTDYMENYRILIDGKDVNAEIVRENTEEHTIELKFEANTLAPNMKANIYVDAMGRDVAFDIIAKTDTLKLIEKIEEPKDEVEAKEIVNEEEIVEVSSNNNSNLVLIGIGVGVVVLGIFFIIRAKK